MAGFNPATKLFGPMHYAATPSSMKGRQISHSARPAEGVPSADANLAFFTRSPATTASSTVPGVPVA
jgi:hypothetical protein